MNTLFTIGNRNKKATTLISEWGTNYCCLAGYDPEEKELSWLTYNTYDALSVDAVTVLMEELSHIDHFIVGASFPEAVFTPINFNGEAVLQTIFPNKNAKFHLDKVNEWQVENHYLLPATIHEAIHAKFKKVTYRHLLTCALKANYAHASSEQLLVHFAPHQFSVIAKKNGQLLLAQVYTYQSPMDVVYYLLKMVDEFDLSKEHVALIIDGLIEEDSDLYKELYNYFLNIQLAASAQPFSVDRSLPSHFFTSLYNLVLCAS